MKRFLCGLWVGFAVWWEWWFLQMPVQHDLQRQVSIGALAWTLTVLVTGVVALAYGIVGE